MLVIDEYFVNGFNGTKAYQKFYPDANDNASDVGFREIYGNLRTVNYLNKKYQEAQELLKTSHSSNLIRLERWVNADITETIGLTPEEVKELPIEIRQLVSRFKHSKRHYRNSKGDITETIETIELQFVSKERAQEMINRHTGFYEKDNAQSEANNVVIFQIPDNGRGNLKGRYHTKMMFSVVY